MDKVFTRYGDEITKIRQARRHTLADMAEVTGYSEGTIQKVTHGKRKVPYLLTRRIIKGYELAIHEAEALTQAEKETREEEEIKFYKQPTPTGRKRTSPTEYGGIIKGLLSERKMTGINLATKLFYSPTYFSQLLRGLHKIPEGLTDKIIDLFNLTKAEAERLREAEAKSNANIRRKNKKATR